MEIKKTVEIGGRQLTFEVGKIAKQADGAATVRLGDTVVLVSACADERDREGVDFLPLTVDYREYTYAGGRIPGGFFKREGRPSEREILTCRVIDRGLRPLFPAGFVRETQLIGMVLSADGTNDPDMLAVCGASLALTVAGSIPYNQPLAGVRVGRIDGELVLFPTHQEREGSDLELVVAGTDEAIVMVECGAREVAEADIIDALAFAHGHIRSLVAVQRQIAAELGVTKVEFTPPPVPWPADFDAAGPLPVACRARGGAARPRQDGPEGGLHRGPGPGHRGAARGQPATLETPWLKNVFHTVVEDITRETALDRSSRLDGRGFEEIRPVTCEVGLLPRAHGSALFTRGETQALVSCTLGTSEDSQIIEAFEGESRQRFMLHYNFPPFSVGEVKFMRGPGRREIGHGNLARRALGPVIPDEEGLPLHHPRGLGHPRVQRLLLHGLGLRRLPRPDGRRRADQGGRGRRRHGPDLGRRAGTRS